MIEAFVAAEAASLVSDGHVIFCKTLQLSSCGRGRISGERRTLVPLVDTFDDATAAEAASLVSDGHDKESNAYVRELIAAEAASLVSDGHLTWS